MCSFRQGGGLPNAHAIYANSNSARAHNQALNLCKVMHSVEEGAFSKNDKFQRFHLDILRMGLGGAIPGLLEPLLGCHAAARIGQNKKSRSANDQLSD